VAQVCHELKFGLPRFPNFAKRFVTSSRIINPSIFILSYQNLIRTTRKRSIAGTLLLDRTYMSPMVYMMATPLTIIILP
jgi:hypothetical protein